MIKSMLIVYAYLVIQMSGVWLLSYYFNNPSIVDIFWPLGLIIAGLIHLLTHPASKITVITAILLIAWGLRLFLYIGITRIRKGLKDKRYISIAQSWNINKSIGYYFHFQLQGLLIFLLSLVFLFISNRATTPSPFLNCSAECLTLLGIIGETIADEQLRYSRLYHPHDICQIGLWTYTRHPNYFFDWLTWCGFALLALPAPMGILGLLSPVILYVIFTHITGPITEAGSIQSKGQQYIDYQKKTPLFFPRLKAKID